MSLYSYNEIKKLMKSNYQIRKNISEGKYYKLDSNLYSDKKYVNPLEIIVKKYPNAIFTMDSAFYYYELTDVVPDYFYLATTRTSTRIKNDNIKQTFVSNDLFEIGKTQIIVENVKINIYNKERLLVELIRKRKSIPFDYYKEIINNYRNIINELDIYKIQEYISYYKNKHSLYETLKREVF